MRSSRSRQATAFSAPVPRGGGGGGVQFTEQTDSVEVEMPEESRARPTRNRQVTAFVRMPSADGEDDDEESGPAPGGVRFADAPQEEGAPKSRQRQATGHPGKAQAEVEGEDNGDGFEERRTVGFRHYVSVVMDPQLSTGSEADASALAPAEMKSTRGRQATSCASKAPMDGGGIRFEESVDEVEVEVGADRSSPHMRPARTRQATKFTQMDKESHMSDSSEESSGTDGDADPTSKPPVRRPSRGRIPTAFNRRMNSFDSNTTSASNTKEFDFGKTQTGSSSEDEKTVKRVLSSNSDSRDANANATSHMATVDDFVAPNIEAHRIPIGTKDVPLLQAALSKLYFFCTAEEDELTMLVDAMDYFAFGDGEAVTVQGNRKGTHFFVIAEGVLEVVRDGNIVAEIVVGMAFGESVILLSGAQNATVRAKGPAKVYGMSGWDVRKVLRKKYKEGNKPIIDAINDVLNSGLVTLLQGLTPYQSDRLYEGAGVGNFTAGQNLLEEDKEVDTLHVIINGEVSLQLSGEKVHHIGRHAVVGVVGMVFGGAVMKAVAETPTQTLTLKRALLQEMFQDRMKELLMESCIVTALARNPTFSELGESRLEAIVSLANVLEVSPDGPPLEEVNVQLAVCLHGEVEIEATSATSPTDGGEASPVPEPMRLNGSRGDCYGEAHLLENKSSWNCTARCVGVNGSSPVPATIALWRGEGLGRLLIRARHRQSVTGSKVLDPSSLPPLLARKHGRSENRKTTLESLRVAVLQDDKESALRRVVVLRTLTGAQVKQLAQAVEVLNFAAGDTIFTKGQEGTEFYIIHSGQLEVSIDGRKIRTLGVGDYVGERALLFKEPRSATVIAKEESELWMIGAEAFNHVVVGPIVEYMQDRIRFQNTFVDMDTLKCIRIIGRGGFGIVKMVQSTQTGTRYALKGINIKHSVEQKQQKMLLNEKSILAELDHPFVVKFVRSYLGKKSVYFLQELVTGGELLDALDVLSLLRKPQAQFYIGSIASALDFLHERRIAYLDLKGENILIDHHGYVKIIDFGIACRVQGGRIYALTGTPHFMAPEVILGKGYTTTADLWSLGVCMYDFMIGHFPFGEAEASNHDIFHNVLNKTILFPKFLEKEEFAKEFLQGLLTRDPLKRMAAGPDGYAELREHPFFRDFKWEELMARQMTPPFIPKGETYAEGEDEKDVDVRSDQEDDGWRDSKPQWQEEFRS